MGRQTLVTMGRIGEGGCFFRGCRGGRLDKGVAGKWGLRERHGSAGANARFSAALPGRRDALGADDFDPRAACAGLGRRAAAAFVPWPRSASSARRTVTSAQQRAVRELRTTAKFDRIVRRRIGAHGRARGAIALAVQRREVYTRERQRRASDMARAIAVLVLASAHLPRSRADGELVKQDMVIVILPDGSRREFAAARPRTTWRRRSAPGWRGRRCARRWMGSCAICMRRWSLKRRSRRGGGR